jgi:hypothetical protein
VGGVTLAPDRHGVANSAYHFDGSTGFIQVADAPDLSGMAQITVSAWVYADAAPMDAYIVRKQASGFDPGYTLRASGGNWLFGVGHSDGYAQAPTSVTLGTWTQLVGTYDGSTITLYVNGTAITSTPSTTAPGVSPDALAIGGDYYFFPGAIDDILIYACAMTPAQVLAAYNP